VCTKC